MLHPSYADLMKVVNKDVEDGEEMIVNSRYSIVLATARRARQLIAGDEPLVRKVKVDKPLSIAVDELNNEKVRIISEEEYTEMIRVLEEAAAAEAAAEAAEVEAVLEAVRAKAAKVKAEDAPAEEFVEYDPEERMAALQEEEAILE